MQATHSPLKTACTCAVLIALTLALSISSMAQHKVLLGVKYGDNGASMTDLKNLEKWQGKKNATVLMFTKMCNSTSYMDSFFKYQLPPIWNNHNVPIISWEAYLCGTTPGTIEGQVANGTYDSYIKAWATRLKTWLKGPDGVYGTSDDRRVYIRMPHEMNGNWYPWSPTSSGEAPWQYVNMFRRVHNIFESLGLSSSHVQFMWIPNANGKYTAESFYPGDGYVDWVGLDGYNFGTLLASGWMTPAKRMDDMVSRVKKLTSKPMALVETASSCKTTSGCSTSAKNTWMSQLFAYAQTKGIKMVVYFNKDVKGDFMMFGGSTGYSSATVNGKWYRTYPAYRSAILQSWVAGSESWNPRILTDSEFAGKFY